MSWVINQHLLPCGSDHFININHFRSPEPLSRVPLPLTDLNPSLLLWVALLGNGLVLELVLRHTFAHRRSTADASSDHLQKVVDEVLALISTK